ncbi:MAG: HAD family hydrolase [Candidatus Bathyarchaeia archaeon]
MKVKALLIDLDGTLVDSAEALETAAKIAWASIGMKKGDGKIGLEIAKRLQQNMAINDLFAGMSKEAGNKFLEAYLKAFYEGAIEKTKPFRNVHKTLENLSRQFSLALITRRPVPSNQLRKELKRHNILKYFKAVVTAKEVSNPQPSPEIIFKAAGKLGVSPKECAVVTDSPIDIQAGKAAGAKTIAVLSGLFDRKELEKEKPDLIVESVDKLLILEFKRDKLDFFFIFCA